MTKKNTPLIFAMDVISLQRRMEEGRKRGGKLGYYNLVTRALDDCALKTCKQHSRALGRHTHTHTHCD